MSAPPVILTVAGFDPLSGAGVTADIKTFAAHGCYGVACITALTVQSTTGVKRVESLPGALVRATLEELAGDLPLAACRLGMLGSGEVAGAVADFLESVQLPIVVLDPVLRSTSGAALLDAPGIEVLRSRLLRLATVVTPNLEEAATLTRLPVDELAEARAAAEELLRLGAPNVVITGGHLDLPIDLLAMPFASGVQWHQFPGRRIPSSSTHGTGCAFASALAANLALGAGLLEAVELAGSYVREAIERAQPLGRGTGPVNHLAGMRSRKGEVL